MFMMSVNFGLNMYDGDECPTSTADLLKLFAMMKTSHTQLFGDMREMVKILRGIKKN